MARASRAEALDEAPGDHWVACQLSDAMLAMARGAHSRPTPVSMKVNAPSTVPSSAAFGSG